MKKGVLTVLHVDTHDVAKLTRCERKQEYIIKSRIKSIRTAGTAGIAWWHSFANFAQ